jgi:hypothetical protein
VDRHNDAWGGIGGAILRHLPTAFGRRVAAAFDDERGVAILVVVMLTLVVSALGATAVVLSNTNHLIAAAERDSEQALLAAKAGIDYGYHLFTQGAVPTGSEPVTFDSFAPGVREPLDGAEFHGTISWVSRSKAQGQIYRIESTGAYRRAQRRSEVILQMVQDPFEYGFVAFHEVYLHHHSRSAGTSFRVESTVFTNGDVEVQPDITLDGSVVAGGEVFIATRATVRGDVFANEISNYGHIVGDAATVATVDALPDAAPRWDRVDADGKKYAWYGENTAAGPLRGDGDIDGERSTYTVRNGDTFRSEVFRKDGRMLADPDVNVIQYMAPPGLDYAAMKLEADRYEPTYFTSSGAAMAYLASKKVTETIGGKTVTTIRVGTDTFPEFLYVVGDFRLQLDPDASADDPVRGILRADGFNLEGGIYASGQISLNGPAFDASRHPAPPAWYQFRINGLPYCLPALVAYEQPLSGSPESWSPADTPIMSLEGSGIEISSAHSATHEGFVFLNGLTFSQGETHLHHTQAADELIRFNGAELAYRVHSCDHMSFTYDPAVRCSTLISPTAGGGTPHVVSFRELR